MNQNLLVRSEWFRSFIPALVVLLLPAACTSPRVRADASYSQPQLNYLATDSVSVERVLPPPPARGSAAEQRDFDTILSLQQSRTQEDCARAHSEERVSLATFFGKPYGPLSDDEVRRWTPFFDKVQDDANYFSRVGKKKWDRPRPYEADSRIKPCIKIEKGAAYPSGHTTIAFAMGRILEKLDPTRANIFEQRAAQIARDRVVGGVHHPTDIEAGKMLAEAEVAAFAKSNAFLADFSRVKEPRFVRTALARETFERARLAQSVPAETTLANPDVALAQDVWLDMIRNAKATIDLGQMYFTTKPGEALEPVLRELENATRRGVKVRLLLSKNMIDNDRAAVERVRHFPNTEVRLMDLSRSTRGILHAKYWIVDNRIIYVGSQNLDWRSLSHIHELGMEVVDSTVAAQLKTVFEKDWSGSVTEEVPALDTEASIESGGPAGPVELVASPQSLNPSGIPAALPRLIQLINGAKENIRVQLLTYEVGEGAKRWPDIDNALRAAAKRGVQIELIVSHWNTAMPELNDIKSLAQVPNIKVQVVTIPQSSQGPIPYARVIHSKYMVVDHQTLWLGTSNWGRGYFLASRDIELITRIPELVSQVDAIFTSMRESPYAEPVTPQMQPRPR